MLYILKVVRKMLESVIRVTQISNCNWPELSKYCGCCKLSTGIYIRSLFSLILVIVLIAINSFGLSKIYYIAFALDGVTVTVIGDRFNKTITEEDLHALANILLALKIYLIIWILLKCLYIVTLLVGLYALFFNKPKILKLAFYTIIPNWIFDVIILIGAKTFLTLPIQICFFICICSEFYNLIAINSQYKQMAFKSRIVPEESPTTSCTSQAEAWNPNIRGGAHCRSCICPTSPYMEIRSEQTTTTSISSIQTPTETFELHQETDNKVVNFKDGPIIFNQDQLEPGNALFLRSSGSQSSDVDGDTDLRYLNETSRPRRPTSLAL